MRNRIASLLIVILYMLVTTLGTTSANQANGKQRWYEIKETDYVFDFNDNTLSKLLGHEALSIRDKENIDLNSK